jgi:hypothetical protein
VKHGYSKGHVPADPDTPRLAVHFGPRLPCESDYLDISRAFAALNPRLPARVDDLGFYRATGQLTRQQLGIWYFYVEAWGAKKYREDWKAMSPETRTVLLEMEQQHPNRYGNLNDDLRGDDLVGDALGITGRTVRRDRTDAIDAMLAYLDPTRPREDAA